MKCRGIFVIEDVDDVDVYREDEQLVSCSSVILGVVFACVHIAPLLRDLANISSIEVVIIERFIASCRLCNFEAEEERRGTLSDDVAPLGSYFFDKSSLGMEPERVMFHLGSGFSFDGVLRLILSGVFKRTD